MDFHLSDEQAMLKESLSGWLERNYGFDQWRKLTRRRPPQSAENWDSFAAMGWLRLSLPEEAGGMGLGALEETNIGEAFGSRLVVEPYLSAIVLSAGLVARAGTPAQRSAMLPAIGDGQLRIAFAFAEAESRFELSRIQTRAMRTEAGYALSGRKILVLDAPGADRIMVLARTAGEISAEAGLGLFIVDPASQGASMHPYTTVDDRQAADIIFDRVIAEEALGDPEAAYPAVAAATDRALVYLCAEGVGAMGALCEQTLAYVKIRKQFGQPIGDFQVIQHRIVDMRVQLECARALTLYAASVSDGEPVERARAASAAKAQVGRSARFVGRAAVQLHGGIGMTDELAVGHYFKRLLMVETMLGDIDFHQKRFASLPSELA
ncbi:acyl-CoA dehydrogenase family protein [Pseudaminobacter sp. 19-2017]|uniref:Acyl-CoA dehydrogenase family protein n=1 Tax=Pseudaminobacter soli (ex Zhang et al. 2022) TaxID=2831468 RepID=A0A942E7R9_9HYPH|nr:acyl-CoA dehydrogenase family protein [Pseudaminobacter soli]MBS3651990.1 acyl-CoA dehydrogenase family protein [Pseudaminobacter soli]